MRVNEEEKGKGRSGTRKKERKNWTKGCSEKEVDRAVKEKQRRNGDKNSRYWKNEKYCLQKE